MKKTGITYNYWIYVLTCFFVMAVVIKIKGRDPGTQWDYWHIFSRLASMTFFATLAWIIGKKYRLHYSLVCGLCVLIMVATGVIWEFSLMLLSHFSFRLEFVWLAIWLIVGSILFVGAAIFIISFPFQFLYFKLRQHFRKLE